MLKLMLPGCRKKVPVKFLIGSRTSNNSHVIHEMFSYISVSHLIITLRICIITANWIWVKAFLHRKYRVHRYFEEFLLKRIWNKLNVTRMHAVKSSESSELTLNVLWKKNFTGALQSWSNRKNMFAVWAIIFPGT